MKRLPAVLLALVLLLGAVSASAQTVACPSGGFSITVPDDFVPVPVYDDPELALYLTGENVNLAVYVSYDGMNGSFQVLSGNELEYGSVYINGVEMFYARGLDVQGNWITYSWARAANSVTIYFVWNGNDDETLSLIGSIMSSIEFEW